MIGVWILDVFLVLVEAEEFEKYLGVGEGCTGVRFFWKNWSVARGSL